MIFAVLMADGGNPNLLKGWMSPGSVAGQLTIMLGVFLLVGFVFFMWAAFFRKRQRHSHHHASDFESGGLPKRRKHRSKLARMLGKKRRRRQRSRERPVNPTLAQIGGLPPRRDEQPPS
jgi:hypothetical protein